MSISKVNIFLVCLTSSETARPALLSAVEDSDQQSTHSVSSQKIIEDLINGLSYLNKYEETKHESDEDLQLIRYRYFAHRIHLALPPFLGKLNKG